MCYAAIVAWFYGSSMVFLLLPSLCASCTEFVNSVEDFAVCSTL